jgi:hypothetical protein
VLGETLVPRLSIARTSNERSMRPLAKNTKCFSKS